MMRMLRIPFNSFQLLWPLTLAINREIDLLLRGPKFKWAESAVSRHPLWLDTTYIARPQESMVPD